MHHRLGALSWSAVLSLVVATATVPVSAQVKPRFMMAFDTSGSMTLDVAGVVTFGDGVGRPATPAEIAAGTLVKDGVYYGCGTTAGLDHDCNGFPDDSRIAIAKAAVRDILGAYGEVEWALARFHQTQSLNAVCQTYSGNPSCGSTLNGGPHGNPQCNNGATDTTPACVSSIPVECRPEDGNPATPLPLKNYSSSSSTISDGCTNYLGAQSGSPCGGFAGDARGDILVGFPDMGPFAGLNNDYAIYNWVDNTENTVNHSTFLAVTTTSNYCDHANGGNCELRASGMTPLGGLLTSVSNYVTPIKTADTKAACRGYYVILLTDGAETCSSDPEGAATALLNAGIETYVIGLAVTGGAQDGLNDIAIAGGTDAAYFPQNQAELSAALSSIVAGSIKSEVCGGGDEDCDGSTDEGFTKYCNPATAVPTPIDNRPRVFCTEPNELNCDGKDDDCDGQTDEGLLNSCGLCPGGVETCNGIDDDCDGVIDDFNNGAPNSICNCFEESCNGLDDDCDGTPDDNLFRNCGSNVGICTFGSQQCVAGGGSPADDWGACVGGTPAGTESCNGLDDDCDGKTDEGQTRSCGITDTGACQLGTEACVSGAWSGTCVGAINPVAEICNGQDDNCNGSTDEGNPGGGGACGTDTGACSTGTLSCSGGSLTCVGGQGPVVETCDNVDNDCDGTIDDGNPGGGAVCGIDTGACQSGTELCVAGGYVCQGSIGPIAEVCNGQDDNCNGSTDEGNPGGGAACGTDVGECVAGVRTCSGGSLSCVGSVAPVTEICDNLDNDCDGLIDDGNPGGGDACGTDVGECVAGTELCVAGGYVCQGSIAAVTEICDGKDNDCDGFTDEGNPGGGVTCGTDTGACTAGTVQCSGGSLVCTGAVGPTAETCDNVDNDCDGIIDDGNPGGNNACGTDTGECNAGTTLCVAGGYVCQGQVASIPERCDNLDNDCDGQTDENNPQAGGACGTETGECNSGTVVCQAGVLSCNGAVGPTAEVCDNLDNNCNGIVDDGNPGGGGMCGAAVGECSAGAELCVAGNFVCQGAVAPKAEVCDGKDNDCDNNTDEGDPGGGGACGTDTGECTPGTLHCMSGGLVCQGAVLAVAEVCNGLDDDCNGIVDNGNPGGGASCGSDTGECKAGAVLCLAGTFVCAGEILPAAELCNGLDDDCNGVVDNGNPQGGGGCGITTGECEQGSLECQAGDLVCTGGVSPSSELCDTLDNDCDGIVDEGNPQGGGACGNATGECEPGSEVCVGGQLVCAGGVQPVTELCNGDDDDCDGETDEQNAQGGGACGTTTGECDPGFFQCQSGTLVCIDSIGPVAELCNGDDDDCDGVVDDGNPEGGSTCGTDVGACTFGVEVCVNGALACAGGIPAKNELCNGVDDDCDGEADESNPQGGGVCGSDVGECAPGQFRCMGGTLVCQDNTTPVDEACDGLDNDCDHKTDEGNPGGGGACGTDVGECVAGSRLCVRGDFVCQGSIGGKTEICNNKDDDCDGEVDEGNPGSGASCGSDTGECSKGTTSCMSGALVCQGDVGPLAESCNGDDDDCDGKTDEGNPGGGGACGDVGTECPAGPAETCGQCEYGALACKAGALVCSGNTSPKPERCDGLDNDCDDKIDEGVDITDPNLGGDCGSEVGECTVGDKVCVEGKIECMGGQGPVEEVCDGKDNDCDGVNDDGIPLGAPCGTDVGACKPGRNVCDVATGVLECEGGVGPATSETCDGVDNDCDGKTDEQLSLGAACGTDVGECRKGTQQCSQGVVVCANQITPSDDEVCDCKDNDCDGETDESDDSAGLCGEGSQCLDCQCVLPCDNENEFGIKCPTGKAPVTRDGECVCVGALCNAASCAKETKMQGDEVRCAPNADGVSSCVCKENACTFVCEGVVCDEGSVCDPLDGTCRVQTCLLPQFACADDEVCDPQSGKCAADACASANCGANEACRDGECLKSCADVKCASGELCVSGECKSNKCMGVTCEGGTLCNPADGKCIEPAACVNGDCGDGFVCDIEKGCEADPCLRTTCPGEQRCFNGECVSECDVDEIKCGGGCIKPLSDAMFCGATGECSGAAAGKVCAAEEVCDRGECTTGCSGGLVQCGASCVDTKTDEDFCGASDDCVGKRAGVKCGNDEACVLGVCRSLSGPGGGGVPGDGSGDPTGGGKSQEDPNQRVVATGGGGCACSVPGADGQGNDMRAVWAFLLAGVIGLRLRRRSLAVRLSRGIVVAAALAMSFTLQACKVDPFCLDCVEPTKNDGKTTDGGSVGSDGGSNDVDASSADSGPGTGDGGTRDGGPGTGGGADAGDAGDGPITCLDKELCNSKDDDCDGKADEGVDTDNDPSNCGGCGIECAPQHAFGQCKKGKCTFTTCDVGFYNLDDKAANGCEYECQAKPAANDKVCDLRDNDCDGEVDEDVALSTDAKNCGECGTTCLFANAVDGAYCAMGECRLDDTKCDAGYYNFDGDESNGCEESCAVSNGAVELCDGEDNDCDGATDEDAADTDPGFATACPPQQGECIGGTPVCMDGSISCSGMVGPTTELCDGLDNDCDGIDDNSIPEVGLACGESRGTCEQGSFACNAGVMECVGGVLPATEVCDGLDNNCDGVIDDGNPEGGEACGSTEVGLCEFGVTDCSGGVLLCLNETGPTDELCDNEDNDCDGVTDEGNPEGGDACGNGTGECRNGTFTCDGGQIVCTGGVEPATELCDGLDNDCNGQFDDGDPEGGSACGTNVGECEFGAEQCIGASLVCVGGVTPASELCDGKDNDCDGVTDEGNPEGGDSCGEVLGECDPGTIQCVTGALTCVGALAGNPETCDGLDNDCDGSIDDGNPGGGASCGTDVGECVAGAMACVSGSVVCTGAVVASPEVCDGKDNDCDGQTDENNPGGGAACGTTVGECDSGSMQCVMGALSCVGATGPTTETCDGQDDDCDGVIDDGNPGGGASCGVDTGECSFGAIACTSGSLACVGGTGVAAEVCDNKDNDCDGQTDELNPGGGASCGSNVGECDPGTIQCQGGTLQCSGGVSGGPETCDNKDNDCDGIFDEGNPGGGGSCGSDVGECAAGTEVCASGTYVCQGEIGEALELCDGLDNDCDNATDEGNPGAGAPCGTSVGECNTGTVQCQGGALVCFGAVGGTVEVCDGLDNDCDGIFDEGNPGGGASCGLNAGECQAGIETCIAGVVVCAGAVEIDIESCDGKDNDCDGQTDENNPGGGAGCGTSAGECDPGVITCQSGALVCAGGTQPGTEICDVKDNDCDGFFDEGNPGGGASCGTDVGACQAGMQTCVGGSVVCVNEITATTEVCDGIDNNCDGAIDEGNPGGNVACGTEAGACEQGLYQCQSGSLVCVGATGPSAETCDNEDNDCDGSYDEGNPGGGVSCGTDTGACVAGVTTCQSGVVSCAGEVAAVAETCDGVDNDCDGTIDDGNPGSGGACGTDLGSCSTGTYQCQSGSLACVGSTGPSTETCDGLDNDCDGIFDEGNPGGGATCGTGTGECVAGAITCVSGTLSCVGSVGPTVETCDTQDDDCDGNTDEAFDLENGDTNNCGTCGTQCTVANGIPKCEDSACGILVCNNGWVNANGSYADGCELQCSFTGPEVCDGVDNDCDGTIDDSPQLPVGFCGIDTGECVAGTVSCQSGSLVCAGTVAAVPEVCDGLDNDCDGTSDDGYGVGVACSIGTGACREEGTIICNGTAAVMCSELTAGTPSSELCDDIDNDCDGQTDEITGAPGSPDGLGLDDADFSTVTITGGVKVFQYEASRPDATASQPGSGSRLACSTGTKIPWTDVTWAEARDACCALNPSGQCTGNGGWRLCDSNTWETACKSTSGACTWGYGTDCSTANGTVSANQKCNGKEYDSDAAAGDQDTRLATGAFANCKSEWGASDIFDMSGNVKEWTNTQVSNGLFEIRGGSFNSIESGRKCEFDYVVGDEGFAFGNTGFRCCNYPAAVSTCYTFTSTDVPESTPGNADTGTASSTIYVPAAGKITDINVIGATGTTDAFGQHAITLSSPAGTGQVTRTLVSSMACSNTSNNDWSFSLDDEAAAGAASCSTPIGNGATVQPTNTSFNGQTLAGFDGVFGSGTWTLNVTDNVTMTPPVTCTSYTATGSPTWTVGSSSDRGTSSWSVTVPSGLGNITDVNVTTTGDTDQFDQNQFTLQNGARTVTLIPSGRCGNTDDWDFTLDDDVTNTAVTCGTSPVGSAPGGANKTFTPTNTSFNGSALSGFDGDSSAGTWTLRVIDNDGDQTVIPTLTSFTLSICSGNAPVYPTITGWGLYMCTTD